MPHPESRSRRSRQCQPYHCSNNVHLWTHKPCYVSWVSAPVCPTVHSKTQAACSAAADTARTSPPSAHPQRWHQQVTVLLAMADRPEHALSPPVVRLVSVIPLRLCQSMYSGDRCLGLSEVLFGGTLCRF
jgi:hypothetical protein